MYEQKFYMCSPCRVAAEFDFSGGWYRAWRDPLIELCSVLPRSQAREATSSSAAYRNSCKTQCWQRPTELPLGGSFFCTADFRRLGSRPAVLGTSQQIQLTTRYLLVTDTCIADGHAEKCGQFYTPCAVLTLQARVVLHTS